MKADSLNRKPRDMAMACNLQLGYHDDNGDGGTCDSRQKDS